MAATLGEQTAKARRRFDMVSLRWQARLDTQWSDRTLPWIVAALLFVLYAAFSLARARSLEGGVDLGLYTQAAWLLDQGSEPNVTVELGSNVLAQQASLLFFPLSLPTRILPIIPTLLVIQSLALALGVVPLWRIARRLALLRVGATATLAFAYAFYPAIHNLNLADFHPEVVAVPGLLAAAYFGLTDRWIPFAACCVLSVFSRADLGIAVVGLGLVLALQGRRRAGAITALAGLGWTLLAVLVVQPKVGDGGYAHIDAFLDYGDTPAEVGIGLLTHPFQALADLTTEENFGVLVFLLAPVVFLPLLAPRYLLPILPLEALYLIADVDEVAVFGQQTVAITAFVFLATAMALSRIGTMGVEKIRVDTRVLGALILATSVFFIRDAASSPYQEPWAWGGRDAVDQARLAAADEIDVDTAVRASPRLVPLLAERPEIYVLDTEGRPNVRTAAKGVDAVIVDGEAVLDWTDDERRVFREGLVRLGFERSFSRDGVEIYVRIDPGD